MDPSDTRTMSPTHESGDDPRTSSLQAKLVLLLEADRPLASSARYSLEGIRRVRLGRGPERAVTRADSVLTVRVPDRWMSSEHAELTCIMGRWHLIDTRSRNGSWVNGKRVARHALSDGDVIELGHVLFGVQSAVETEPDEPADVDAAQIAPATPGLLTLSRGLARELDRIARLAPSPVSFLITGESGTGKEVLAQAIHQLSGRGGEFVGVNCGAIPETLVESELFGHVKGAFSGAVADRPGLVRSAHRGTLFLDEIGDLPAPAQAVFLRMLQERRVRPVGETRTIPVDIRLVSATHKNIEAQVKQGTFRQDLYSRLNGVRIRLPSLRERREDLGILIAALLPKVARDKKRPRFTIEAARAMFAYCWPLNIRELENCLLTATILAEDGPIGYKHLPEAMQRGELGGDGLDKASEPFPEPGIAKVAPLAPGDSGPSPKEPMAKKPPVEIDKAEIVATLASYDGNIARTARALGLSRQSLYRRIERFGIPVPRGKSKK